jgi:hypothetical protein
MFRLFITEKFAFAYSFIILCLNFSKGLRARMENHFDYLNYVNENFNVLSPYAFEKYFSQSMHVSGWFLSSLSS